MNGDRPLATIQPMMEAVMDEERAVLPTMYTVLSLVANFSTIPEGGGGETVGSFDIQADLVEDDDEDGRRREAIEIILRREAPAWGGLPWKISALLRLYSQRECDVALIREVPDPSAPTGWAVEDQIGWKVFDSELEEAATGRGGKSGRDEPGGRSLRADRARPAITAGSVRQAANRKQGGATRTLRPPRGVVLSA